jgi:Fur family ferric uptake transcriptional regulator
MKNESLLSQIEDDLKKNGFSVTRQRRLIISEILRNGPHFDIESLTEEIRRKYSDAGRATVYRTVKILTDAGIIKKQMLGEPHSHYEVVNREHGHFVCTSCGRIIELSCPALENFLSIISKNNKLRIDRHSIELFGICEKCSENMLNVKNRQR